MNAYPYFGPLADKETRKAEILKILAAGKVVRFSIGTIWKDVDRFEPDDCGDLEAFRRSENARSPFVCWEAAGYSIEAVER